MKSKTFRLFMQGTLAMGVLSFATIGYAAKKASKKKPLDASRIIEQATLDEAHKVLKPLLLASKYRFTPELKKAFLKWSKTEALAKVKKAGHVLPVDFLQWIDDDPVRALTVYGTPETAARQLIVLRSLEIDFGVERMRQKYPQYGLAYANAFSRRLDHKTLTSKHFHLKKRPLFKLVIPPFPLKRVNTNPTDRPLDLEDHIINFLKENSTTKIERFIKDVDGKFVMVQEERTRPLEACDVLNKDVWKKKFNTYMEAHGQSVRINYKGGVSPWNRRVRGHIVRAARMFMKAYQEKGFCPKPRSLPRATPIENIAFRIRIHEDKLPKRRGKPWPRFDLNSHWPIMRRLCGGAILREREFIWKRYRDLGIWQGYARYTKLGLAAGYPSMATLRPTEFYERSYPRLIQHGGVCGLLSNIGRKQNVALNIPGFQAGQPGHSCYVTIEGNNKRGFRAVVHQSIGGRTRVSGIGHISILQDTLHGMNFDLLAYLEHQFTIRLEKQLSKTLTLPQRQSLLESALLLNPYDRRFATKVVRLLKDPLQAVLLGQKLKKIIMSTKKSRCPRPTEGSCRVFGGAAIRTLLLKAPAPVAMKDRKIILDYLKGQADLAWAKYAIAVKGLDKVKQETSDHLKASLASKRTIRSSTAVAKRIEMVGTSIPDQKERVTWANELQKIIVGKETFKQVTGRRRRRALRTIIDPSVSSIFKLIGDSPDVLEAVIQDLKSAIKNGRTYVASRMLNYRFNAILSKKRNIKKYRPFIQKMATVLAGNELCGGGKLDPLATSVYCYRPNLSLASDKLVEDFKTVIKEGRTKSNTIKLYIRLKLLSTYMRGKPRSKMAKELLEVILGNECYSSNSKNPKVLSIDPNLRLIYALRGNLEATKDKLVQDFKEAISSKERHYKVNSLFQRLRLLSAYYRNPGKRKVLGETLFGIISGYENYTPNPNTKMMKLDPSLPIIYGLGGGVENRQEILIKALKDSLAGTRSLESSRIVAKRLSTFARYCRNKKIRKDLGAKLLQLINGNEVYVPNPSEPSVVALDPAVNTVYSLATGNLGSVWPILLEDYKKSLTQKRNANTVITLSQRLKSYFRYSRIPQKEKRKKSTELLKLLIGNELYSSNPKRPLDVAVDPSFLEILRYRVNLGAAKQSALTQLEAAVKGKRTVSKQKALSLLIRKLYGFTFLREKRTLFGVKLVGIMNGNEFFKVAHGKRTRQYKDPCYALAYRFAKMELPKK